MIFTFSFIFYFFFFTEWTQQMHFYYNVSYLSTEEQILAAEFHVFKLRPKASTSSEIIPSSHVIEVRIFTCNRGKDIHM